MNNINLLPKKNAAKDHHRAVRILRVGAVISCGIVVVFAIWLFASHFDKTLAIQIQKREDLTKSLTQLQSRAVKVLLLEERLTSIGTILPQRNSYEDDLTQLTSLLPPAVSIDQISIHTGSLKLMLSSPTLSSLTDLSHTFAALVQKKQLFKSVTIDTITVENGKNSLSISASLL